MPSGQSSATESPTVSLWIALRAAVLRLAVSQLWSVALDGSRAVAAGVTHRQNPSMVNLAASLFLPALDIALARAVGVLAASQRGQQCGLTLRSSGRPSAAA